MDSLPTRCYVNPCQKYLPISRNFFYDFDSYDDILYASKKNIKNVRYFREQESMYFHYMYMTPPPLTLDPGTLAHRYHAHMLPALVSSFFLSHQDAQDRFESNPNTTNFEQFSKFWQRHPSLIKIIMTVMKQQQLERVDVSTSSFFSCKAFLHVTYKYY